MKTAQLVEYIRAVGKVSDPSIAALLTSAADRLCEQSAVLIEIATSGVGMVGNAPCIACTHNVDLCNKAMNGGLA